MESVLELVAGSYEQILFGYQVQRGEKEWTLKAEFTHHAHTASLSAVAANERYIATGSKDENIQLYDMKNKREHGVLLHHNGTISCLEFYGASHLVSGAEDGLLCVWSTRKWECLKSIKAHMGQVSFVSVHPSGKLALSVGTDRTLRTWNLIDGRSAFIKNIKQSAHIVMWSPAGDKYVVAVNNKIDIYKLETATVMGTFSCPKRISSITFLSNSVLAVAGDDEVVRLFHTDSQKCVCEFVAHENRVKSLDSCTVGDLCVLVSASNDGFIKLWNVSLEKVTEAPALLGMVNTTARLTCLSVWQPGPQGECSAERDVQAVTSQASTTATEPKRRKKEVVFTEEVIIEEPNCTKRVKTRSGEKKKKQKTNK